MEVTVIYSSGPVIFFSRVSNTILWIGLTFGLMIWTNTVNGLILIVGQYDLHAMVH